MNTIPIVPEKGYLSGKFAEKVAARRKELNITPFGKNKASTDIKTFCEGIGIEPKSMTDDQKTSFWNDNKLTEVQDHEQNSKKQPGSSHQVERPVSPPTLQSPRAAINPSNESDRAQDGRKTSETSSKDGPTQEKVNYVTVLTSQDNTNKLYKKLPGGTIEKIPAKYGALLNAETIPVPDLHSMQNLLQEVGNNPYKKMILGFIPESIGQPYLIDSTRNIAKNFGISEAEAGKGFRLTKDGKTFVAARTKANFSQSSWFMFDRDEVEGMPDHLIYNDFTSWWGKMQSWLPMLQGAGFIVTSSNSARVLVNGNPFAKDNEHVYLQARNPSDVGRFGKAALVHSFSNDAGFRKPVISQKTGLPIGIGRPWSMFDPTTFSREREDYCGAPTVEGHGLTVALCNPRVQAGGPVDTELLINPTEMQEKESGLTLSKEAGSYCLTDGCSLTGDIEITTKTHGTISVDGFKDSDHKKLRCQSPFRPDSTSFAAYLGRFKDGNVFLFDVGTGIRYKYAEDAGLAFAAEIFKGNIELQKKASSNDADSKPILVKINGRDMQIHPDGTAFYHHQDGCASEWIPAPSSMLGNEDNTGSALSSAIRLAHKAIEDVTGKKPDINQVSHGAGAFALTPIKEALQGMKASSWLIQGYIHEASLVEIFGQSGHYKSFLAVALASCIATGTKWMGQAVTQGMVIYVAGEGNTHLARRFSAWSINNDVQFNDNNLFLSTRSAKIIDAENVANVIRIIAQTIVAAKKIPSVVFVDTLARNFGGGDENSTEDMSAFIDHLEELQLAFPGVTIILIHHTGQTNTDRARGSYALLAAVDTEFKVEAKEEDITFTNTKMKDSANPPTKRFKAEVINLPFKEYNGETATSVALNCANYVDVTQEMADVERNQDQAEKQKDKDKWEWENKALITLSIYNWVQELREKSEYPTKTVLRNSTHKNKKGQKAGKDKVEALVESAVRMGIFQWVEMPKNRTKTGRAASHYLDILAEEFSYPASNTWETMN